MDARSVQLDGLAIRRRRMSKLWSQQKLAEKTHLSKKSIEDIENNRHPVLLDTAGKIAEALDAKVEDLLVSNTSSPQLDRESSGIPRSGTETVYEKFSDGTRWLRLRWRALVGSAIALLVALFGA